jgi:hypothetical protein
MRRLAVVNNLWVAIQRSFFTMAIPPVPLEDFLVDHNTVIPTRHFSFDIDGGAPALVRFQFTNNLTGFGAYGVKFPQTEATVGRWMPDALIAGNALVHLGRFDDGRQGSDDRPWEPSAAMYVVFPSAAAAGLAPDGSLRPDTPLKRAGTDGKDVGVDFQQLRQALLGRARR